ncbi:hypothetical protein NC651_026197 [Populus alba x Populus x berolinensis]|nr:hypothetical protein NC651_026197 [Populus alba x Populus x berolinensis]
MPLESGSKLTTNSPATAGLLVSPSNQNTESQNLSPHEDQRPGKIRISLVREKAYKRQRRTDKRKRQKIRGTNQEERPRESRERVRRLKQKIKGNPKQAKEGTKKNEGKSSRLEGQTITRPGRILPSQKQKEVKKRGRVWAFSSTDPNYVC